MIDLLSLIEIVSGISSDSDNLNFNLGARAVYDNVEIQANWNEGQRTQIDKFVTGSIGYRQYYIDGDIYTSFRVGYGYNPKDKYDNGKFIQTAFGVSNIEFQFTHEADVNYFGMAFVVPLK